MSLSQTPCLCDPGGRPAEEKPRPEARPLGLSSTVFRDSAGLSSHVLRAE